MEVCVSLSVVDHVSHVGHNSTLVSDLGGGISFIVLLVPLVGDGAQSSSPVVTLRRILLRIRLSLVGPNCVQIVNHLSLFSLDNQSFTGVLDHSVDLVERLTCEGIYLKPLENESQDLGGLTDLDSTGDVLVLVLASDTFVLHLVVVENLFQQLLEVNFFFSRGHNKLIQSCFRLDIEGHFLTPWTCTCVKEPDAHQLSDEVVVL